MQRPPSKQRSPSADLHPPHSNPSPSASPAPTSTLSLPTPAHPAPQTALTWVAPAALSRHQAGATGLLHHDLRLGQVGTKGRVQAIPNGRRGVCCLKPGGGGRGEQVRNGPVWSACCFCMKSSGKWRCCCVLHAGQGVPLSSRGKRGRAMAASFPPDHHWQPRPSWGPT